MIIPSSLRADMLKLIHQGHFGLEKCKQRARFSMYWAGINKQIEQLVSSCSTCLNHRNKQRRESMISYDVPDAPWVKVASDLFTLNNRLRYYYISGLSSEMYCSIPSGRHEVVYCYQSDKKYLFNSWYTKDYI